MFVKTSKVEIFFKSGNRTVAWFDKFETKYNGDTLTKLNWTFSYPKNRFMFISLENIENINIIQRGYRFMRLKEIVDLMRGNK